MDTDHVTLIRVTHVTLIRVTAALVAFCVFIPIFLVPYWRIFSRAGFPGPLALLMIVPLVNLIVLYYVAFARWNVAPDKPSVKQIT
jgi:hypothetical protein